MENLNQRSSLCKARIKLRLVDVEPDAHDGCLQGLSFHDNPDQDSTNLF